MSTDYKSTLFLPATNFPMKAGLPNKEPGLLERWETMNLFGLQRAQSKGREKFILHDGPPYANGHLHMGHAMNKVLKDVISRSQQMMGKDAHYVPGWDCHGLPIEWKIEEKYRNEGKNKDEVPVVEFRKECREFADHWVDIQREEFKRLGVIGEWDRPYLTMSYDAEAQIVRELLKFSMNGGLYRGSKPVMWSPVEKTALAEAEVEYHDHTSTTIYVRFPVVKGPDAFSGATILIWTTTPWTMPGNRAISYGHDIDYVGVEVTAVEEGSLAVVGEKFLVAEALLEDVQKEAGISACTPFWTGKGSEFAEVVCQHPFHGKGYEFDVPLLDGDHVTTDAGTGFVHTAPGHGQEDYEVGKKFGIEIPQTVDEDGTFYKHVPLFAGEHVYKCNDHVADELEAVGALMKRGKIKHSYPHSWRSKAPLIFRNTSQWFISMETNNLREIALKAIDDTKWYPKSGHRRLYSMVENRPDWVLSRQRAWGVPITIFVNKETGEILRDEAVNNRIVEITEKEGSDAWFDSSADRFLGADYDPNDYEMIMDILDVWFDSGSTHAFTLENRPELKWPADLYLEGTDQHRGWFHSSLLESCGTRGRAPYDAVLTHGFVLDGKGRKMSKSLGNIIAPEKIIKQSGADILRLWVVASDYTDDLRISNEIIQGQVDSYRRLRNTLRYILGNLAEWDESERVDVAEMPELEQWVLHRVSQLDEQIRHNCKEYEFSRMFSAILNFCTLELSAFYFDIRKDVLYCDGQNDLRRRAARTVLDQLFHCLTSWLAPILVFTAEETWLARFPGEESSVHLNQFPTIPANWRNDDLHTRWSKVRAFRRVVTGALEIERREKRIGASLQAAPVVYVNEDYNDLLTGLPLDDICITSGLTLEVGEAPDGAFTLEDVPFVAVVPQLAEGDKCQRCWKVLDEVGTHETHKDLCHRCADVVEGMELPAEAS
ncbi:isoleucine--tRNA ligase [Sneathiella chinensis]|uniref:Isoleucine--tRNA ligase n=1 Tax=Sneathiella chinensis TaxID=349750 RepID=A0ABQ5U1A6_9PROT|nr:isoleucine--tRNA ligase [Sneathiella chinensis]GLQ05639.1 isoleucine--tRNA ligase [Sneathiella chinensis]